MASKESSLQTKEQEVYHMFKKVSATVAVGTARITPKVLASIFSAV